MISEKTCTKCKIVMSIDCFYNDKNGNPRALCKNCAKEASKKYYVENKEKCRSKMKEYYINNKDKIAINSKVYYLKNRQAGILARKKWHMANKEINNARSREYYKKNRDRCILIGSKYVAERHRNDPKFRLNSNMRCAIRECLNGSKKGRRWEVLVGYTFCDLKNHLEKQFKPGMTWDNYGQWHIDHIIPISAFNFETPEHEDFKRCWALKNLRPLWATDNMRKSNKLIRHFQPSLLI